MASSSSSSPVFFLGRNTNTNSICISPLSLSSSSAFFPSSILRRRLPVLTGAYPPKPNNSKPSDSSEQKWVAKGLITESLPNGMFWVRLENGDVVLGYVSGKIRRNSIRMLPGDKVKIEVSRYDSTRGRIVYRIGSKDI
ncbi:hypothetical protein OSB04_026079 [Centaurea solstitialis]|uniref:Translation initiation factor IF-1, chloroplastic n=1 Tax=Centaurea solstitialis TaxID=347529 RepID=A0AA38SWB6_9ASTR|nr:hypothetical protein OSB04_026079 [Centaurea solstitialis]